MVRRESRAFRLLIVVPDVNREHKRDAYDTLGSGYAPDARDCKRFPPLRRYRTSYGFLTPVMQSSVKRM